MNRTIVFFAVTIMSLMLLCSCGGRGHEEEEQGDVLTMEQARQQEPNEKTDTAKDLPGSIRKD